MSTPERLSGLPKLRARIWNVFRLLVSGNYEEARNSVNQLSRLFLARVRSKESSPTRLVDMLCAAACMSMVGDRYNADVLLSSAEKAIPLVPLDRAYREELMGTLLMLKRKHDDAVRRFARAADEYYYEHIRGKGEVAAYKDASFCYAMAEEFELARKLVDEFMAKRAASPFYEFREEEDRAWEKLIDLLVDIFSSQKYTLEQFHDVVHCFEKLSRVPETCLWRRFSVIWHKLGEPSIVLWPSISPEKELVLPPRPTEAIMPIAKFIDLSSMNRRSLLYSFRGDEDMARTLLELTRSVLPNYLALVERRRRPFEGAFLACERYAGLLSSSFKVGASAKYDLVVEVIVCHKGQKGSLSITMYSHEDKVLEELSSMLDEAMRYHKRTLEERVEPLKDHIYCPNCGWADVRKFRLMSAEKGLVECLSCGFQFIVPSYCVDLLRMCSRQGDRKGDRPR